VKCVTVPRFELTRSEGSPPTVFEIEARGALVETVTQKPDDTPRYSVTRYSTPNQAEEACSRAIEQKTKARYVAAGDSQMLAPAFGGGGSSLLLDEMFRAGDPRLLDEVLASTEAKKLGALAQPWFQDTRPAMREALLHYVEDGCERIGHRLLVKRLFKLAEEKGDDQLMARFMVAFDRLARRYAVLRRDTWNAGPKHLLVSDPAVPERDEDTHAGLSRFSRATRRYLARRAFRYFRKIGKADAARAGRAMMVALPLYRDAHLDTPMKLLDA
jgi:hypothetical protein